ncbi:MAG: FlgD immunoglobulin-like domain containing protein [Candidatus Zhuqueibacterota bacterium]
MKYKIFLLILAFHSFVFSEENKINSLKKPAVYSSKYFDVNRIVCSVHNDGIIARHPISGNSDFKFDDDYLVYTSGLWLAAKVNGAVRASAADFNTDWIGGAIDEFGNPFGKEDSTFRVYKISRGDNAATNPDYAQWPSQLGAPTDAQGNPLILGDQTLWCSFTDAFVDERIWYNICPPLGAEVHLMVWGWNEVDNAIFVRYEIINKSAAIWEDTYFGMYSDPDVGDANNDLTGSDSTLSLVYCYDNEKTNYYNSNYSVGYVLLESPLIPSTGDTAFTWWGRRFDFQNAPIYAPRIEKHDSYGWGEVSYTSSETATQIYNRLQCLSYKGEPAINPVTNLPTKWTYSGEPVTETGWIDNIYPPRDRRMMLSTGPVTLAPGDTAAITLAIMAVQRNKTMDTIVDVKSNAGAALEAFQNGAGLYSEKKYAPPGQQGLLVPIRLLNFRELEKLEFTIRWEKEKLIFRDIEPVNRAKNFSVNSDQINPGTTRVELVNPVSEALSVGNGEIFQIEFDVAVNGESELVDFRISNTSAMDIDGNLLNLKSITNTIEIEQMHPPPRLYTPPNGHYLDGMNVQFSWSRAGKDSENFTYLKFENDTWSKVTVFDTTLTMPMREFVFNSNRPDPIGWYVAVMDYSEPLLSVEKYYFSVPSVEELSFARQIVECDISDTTIAWPRVEKLAIQLPYFYLIKAIDLGTERYELTVLRLSQNNFQLVNKQDLSPFLFDGQLIVSGDRAFSYYNSLIYMYTINQNQQFVFDKYATVDSPIGVLLKNEEYFYILSKENSAPNILIYKVNEWGDLVKLSEISLAGWSDETRESSGEAIRLKDGRLFVAYGDWGIFDVSDPGAPQLLVRCDIPDEAASIDYEDGKVYVGGDNYWLGIYDITSSENPLLVYSETVEDSWNDWAKHLSVYEGKVYLHDRWRMQVCHYEPGRGFVIDGIFNQRELVKMFQDRIYVIDWRWDWQTTISIYENSFVSRCNSKENGDAVKFNLVQNYPNPFNDRTQIHFDVERTAQVAVTIYNIHGQKVKTLLAEVKAAGSHRLEWDGKNDAGRTVASGVYLCELRASDRSSIKKILLLK